VRSRACYDCGHWPCICDDEKLNLTKLRSDVAHAYQFGKKYDRDALTWGELRTLLRRLDRLGRSKR
jgi:hypothetical protein